VFRGTQDSKIGRRPCHDIKKNAKAAIRKGEFGQKQTSRPNKEQRGFSVAITSVRIDWTLGRKSGWGIFYRPEEGSERVIAEGRWEGAWVYAETSWSS